MQKVINVLAVLSFLGLTSILATSGYVYWRRDAIREQVTENITESSNRGNCRRASWYVGRCNA